MTGSAAEIVFFPLRPNSNPQEILSRSTDSWGKHPGFRAAYYGVLVEDEKISCLVLEWDGKEDLIRWTGKYDVEAVERGKEELIDGEGGLEPFAGMFVF